MPRVPTSMIQAPAGGSVNATGGRSHVNRSPLACRERATHSECVAMSAPGTEPRSLWWSEPPLRFAPLAADLDAEVVIVGGGIAGVTLAYTLAEQGAVVALLEAGPIAGSASGRNAGFLLAAPAEPYPQAIEFWGRPGARAVLEIGRRSHVRVRELVEKLGIECDYRSNGSVRLARSEEEAEEYRASLPLLQTDGFVMREL